MAAQTMFSMGMFPVGTPIMEDNQSLSELPRNHLPVPQLVMLANVAAVTSAEAGGCDSSVADEKEMMELKTVGCNYSDSEDESIIRYSYDNQNHREVCIIEYPESPVPGALPVVVENNLRPGQDENREDDAQDLSRSSEPCPPASPKPPPLGAKRKVTHAMVVEAAKKKKPFHCKPCNFNAQSEEEFVEHLGTHATSKMMVVNRVEGRTRTKGKETAAPGCQATEVAAESAGEAGTGSDSKGVIRCERCGYNTNRYDHYIAHLKHHSKEGEDHRVFKCTLCPYTTVSQYHWRKHLRNHFPSKLHTCDQCSYFSDRKSNYIQHIRTHTGVRPFRCMYCNYSSSQKTHLTRHMRTHSGERPFKCESCNYLAANQHEVTRHARQVHNGPKPLGCPYCQYKTADRSNFKKHVELHLHPRQFRCPLCKYAASKKCNLQYHIKSRHSGCDIAIDVSKVRLRIKKPGSETSEENTESGMNKSEESTNTEVSNLDDGEDDEMASSPINLSVKKTGKPSSTQTEGHVTDKAHKKCEVTQDKEKPQKVKDSGMKKILTRQKKIEKAGENTKEKTIVKDVQMEALPPTDNKVRRRPKKQPVEKVGVQGQTQQIKESLRKDQKETERSEEERAEGEKMAKEKEEKERFNKEKDEQLKKEKSGKAVKGLVKPRKNGLKKSEKVTEHVDKALQKQVGSEKSPVNKVGKTKARKKKAVEALDLSTKQSSEETGATKPKRLKLKVSDKLQTKLGEKEKICSTAEPCPVPQKDSEANQMVSVPVKPRKTRKTNKNKKKTQNQKKTTAPSVEQKDSVIDENTSPVENTQSPPRQPLQVDAQQDIITPDSNAEPNLSGAKLSQPASPKKETASSKQTQENLSEKTKKSTPSTSCSSGGETPSPSEDSPPSTFRQPVTKPTSPSLELPGQRRKPTDAEEDEGIHSSHDGGSDISDSASEGSDDSGLNGTGTGSGKMANDPETPTDEIPTPTEMKSHMCIFCDRTFPLEVEYRRHLNRHLINVYYMDNTAKEK
ncbi:RE1-silencing transcription factor [Lampris incognitus]|uniref:RE1-silencing transcription factor n=1 Tax=Lampris incognitus TaxID=2546036 RepID=UPI0024B5E355|nr:RE1-silencing transcription factor [Lampris incognitus]